MKVEKRNHFFDSISVWCCVTLFYCYQFLLRLLPNIAMPKIVSKYNVSVKEFAFFTGVYYLGYVIVHVPVAMLLGKVDGRVILSVSAICSFLGLIPLVYSDSWSVVVIGRVLSGIGASATTVGALHIFYVLYPTKSAKMLGFMVFFGLLTVVYTGTHLATMIRIMELEIVLGVLAYIGLALGILAYFVMPRLTRITPYADTWGSVKSIFCNYKVLLTSLFAGLMVAPLEGFANAWGSAFIVAVYGIKRALADSMSLSVLLGMCGGCVILPYITDRIQSHYTITILAGIGMVASFFYILSGKADINSLYCACIIIGVFCAYQVVIISKISTFVSKEKSGMAAIIANMIIMSFGLIFNVLIGLTLDGRKEEGGINQQAFIDGISIIPIATGIATIGMLVLATISVVQAKLKSKKSK